MAQLNAMPSGLEAFLESTEGSDTHEEYIKNAVSSINDGHLSISGLVSLILNVVSVGIRWCTVVQP
jgi:hypothetical protein